MIVEEFFIQLGALVKIVIPNLKINTVTKDWSMLRDKLKSSSKMIFILTMKPRIIIY